MNETGRMELGRPISYRSKIDWWIPVVVVVSVAGCIAGPAMEGELPVGILLGLAVAAIEIFIFAGERYRIDGNRLGVRNFFRWRWYPIDCIAEIRRQRGILSAPALSFDRLSITFTDKNILNSPMPLEISPADRSGFIVRIRAVNPAVTVR